MQGKCLLLINSLSGNSGKIGDGSRLKVSLGKLYSQIDTVIISEKNSPFDIGKASKDYDAVAVCGGDGTFNSALNATAGGNAELIYIPCGTFNDCAHTLRSLPVTTNNNGVYEMYVGRISNFEFSYVAACGSFTPIGYLPKAKYKKLFKRLVYYFYALKEYKIHDIKAEIKANDFSAKGKYTLIMAIKSRYCFGLPFNKLYSSKDCSGHLLLIKKPEGVFRHLELFFLFFRAFFIGFKKEKREGKVNFVPFSELQIKTQDDINFCVDGECVKPGKFFTVEFGKRRVKVMKIREQ